MKKSIKSLVEKLTIQGDSLMKGGFTQIKGGFSLSDLPGNNVNCTNTQICAGNNTGPCSNTLSCSGSNTAGAGQKCANHSTCS